MRAAPKSQGEGEGGDALAFAVAGAFAAVVLLPATALLDLKRFAAQLTAALLLAGLAWAMARSSDLRFGPWRWVEALLGAWRWALVAVAGYALAQRLGWDPVSAYAEAGSRFRSVGTFGNASYLAAFLCLSWPLLLAWSGPRRALAVALAWAALFATQSRAGLLAWAVQLGAWAWRAWHGGWRPRPRLAWAAAAAGVTVLGLFPWQAWARPTLRWTLWKASWGLWLQRPWLGWSPTPFAVALQEHGDPAAVQALQASGQYAGDPHQLCLAIACGQGLAGLLLFLLAAGWALRAAWRTRRPSLQAAALGLLGLLVESQVDRFFFSAGVAVPLLALLGALAWREGEAFPLRARQRWAALLPLAASGLCLLVAVEPLLDYRRAVGVDLGAGAAAIAPAQGLAPLQAAASGSPDPAAQDRLGAALAAGKRYAEAAVAYREALRLAPSTGRAQNLGNCAMMLGDLPGAVAAFQRAVALDPANADAHFSLGYALFYQKRLKDALAELDLALRLDPGNAAARTLKEQIVQ